MAQWTSAYINDLPDSAFLYIEPGGEKDDDGKTKPRSLRHFPVKDASGNVDAPHLRNALSRIPQSDVPDAAKAAAIKKAEAMLKKQNGEQKSAEYPPIAKYIANDRRTATVALEASFEDIRGALNAALREKYPSTSGDGWRVWVIDIYDDIVVYELDNELWRCSYSYANGEATLGGTPERVRRSYEPVGQAQSQAQPAAAMCEADQLSEDTLALGFTIPSGEPPSLFRLFPQGMTRTTKGDLLFDDQSATDVMAAMADHGKSDLPIDYGHGMLSMVTTPDSGKAAGWFRPSIVGGELWASDVQWTPSAEQALRNREYRYHSPAVKYDRETRRVTRLINVALTNLHATKGLRPLVASESTNTSAPGSGATEASTMSEKLFARLGAKDEAEAIIMLAEHESWTKGVLAALSCTKLDDAIPAIEKLGTQAGESVKLAEQIVTLTAERDALQKAEGERKQQALIAELSEAGKLPPSLHEWALTISYEQLSEFGEKAVANAATETTTPRSPASADPEITPQMKAMAKQAGVSVDALKETLKARAAEAE